MGFGFVLGLFGGVLLAHAAYSTIQYRGMLKIMEEEFSGPPLNVAVELLVGLGMCMWAGLDFPGRFHSILPDSEENRFIDVVHDQKLHLWKSDASEYSFTSLVSAVCSCGSEKYREGAITSPSWIAAGLSSGYCRLLDARSGNIVAIWRAHDGYITKLAAPEDHLLVSSSLDKTLRVWDLRRNLGSQSNVFRGHQDGISSFSVWGQDVISVSRNKIALTSLSRSTNQGRQQQQQLSPQKLYSADKGTRNLSVLSTIDVLPFSRLFLVGTEDGYLKICS